MYILSQIRNKMKWKLIAVLSALIVGVVSSIGIVSYLKISAMVKYDVQRLSNQVLKQASLNLERYFYSYSQGFLLISVAPDLEKWLQLDKGRDLDSYLLFQDILKAYGQPFFFQHPEILSITLYNENGNEINRTVRYGFNKDYKFYVSDLERYTQTDNFTFEVGVSSNYVDEAGKPMAIPVITMVKKLRYGKHTGFLKIDIDLEPALKIVNELELGDNGYGFISDVGGHILVHPDQMKIGDRLPADMAAQMQDKPNGAFFRENNREFVLFDSVQPTNWRAVVVVPYREFARSIILIKEITLVIAVAALFVSIVLAVGISSSFTKRIAKLRKTIKSTVRGRFDTRVDIEGSDEIAELGVAYNAMLEDLQSTVNALAESKVQQQRAMLSALQSQIDSHFLYNTLESINSLANLAGHTQIEDTTIALSKMLRYTSEYSSTVVPLSDEVRHLQNYLHIMKIRFGDELDYTIAVDPGCDSAYGLKAMMQPIAENSMKHGAVQDVPLLLTVAVEWVSIQGDPYVSVVMMDNGKGFPEEKLQEISGEINRINLSPLQHGNAHIGLLNTHFRLKMYYQNDPHAGISLSNRTDCTGAVVTIVFPFQGDMPRTR
ncbi:two-component system, sensor histidine kinase YesM [Paenibacillus sp. UNCCL117]|uniref:sensor histidine kinase n=1 Tax=unclassified Paenibacillus TaxID=185978 RepID=UPI00088241EA|nr:MULTISPECIES: sensor histidine kinase [unclassified Paenibacillus]SDD65410.1 two-component system, sensor histidine kinase YesM [Paenibacillus sp. cl123]SFW58129.1 two-component system, sensor histidine kinase YesM [Paenibacillus sp. UNCCL117]